MAKPYYKIRRDIDRPLCAIIIGPGREKFIGRLAQIFSPGGDAAFECLCGYEIDVETAGRLNIVADWPDCCGPSCIDVIIYCCDVRRLSTIDAAAVRRQMTWAGEYYIEFIIAGMAPQMNLEYQNHLRKTFGDEQIIYHSKGQESYWTCNAFLVVDDAPAGRVENYLSGSYLQFWVRVIIDRPAVKGKYDYWMMPSNNDFHSKLAAAAVEMGDDIAAKFTAALFAKTHVYILTEVIFVMPTNILRRIFDAMQDDNDPSYSLCMLRILMIDFVSPKLFLSMAALFWFYSHIRENDKIYAGHCRGNNLLEHVLGSKYGFMILAAHMTRDELRHSAIRRRVTDTFIEWDRPDLAKAFDYRLDANVGFDQSSRWFEPTHVRMLRENLFALPKRRRPTPLGRGIAGELAKLSIDI